MKYQILIKFPGDINPRDISHLLRARSYQQENRLFNTSHRSVVDKVSFRLKYDPLLTDLICRENGRIECQVLKDGTACFTGWIAPTLSDSWGRSRQPGDLSLEIEDNSDKLDAPLSGDFCYPAVIGQAPYKILDKADPDHSIIHQILFDAGYTGPAAACPDITETVLHIAGIKGNETYRSFLDDLLYEYGYCFYFDRTGAFQVYNWDKDDVTPDHDLAGKLGVVDPPGRHKNSLHNDGVKIIWSGTEVKENALLFRASLPLDEENGFAGSPIASGGYYPSDSDIQAIYQEFKSDWLDTPYLTRSTRLRNPDISLITTSNHSIQVIKDDEIVLDLEEYSAFKGRVRYHNPADTFKKIYNLEISGKALFRKTIREAICPESSSNPLTYTTRFVYDPDRAARLANALRLAQFFENFTYTFSIPKGADQVPSEGQIVHLKESDPNIDTMAIVTERVESEGSPNISYRAVGVTAYAASPVLDNGIETGNKAFQEEASKLDLYRELDEGYDSPTGGTTVPAPPEVKAYGEFKMILLKLDHQPLLTNFSHYEIQVSDQAPDYQADPSDGGCSWYPPRNDGTDWKFDEPAAWAEFYGSEYSHAGIPHTGTSISPAGRTLYYRIRRVTKSDIKSDWTIPVSNASATTKILVTADLLENIINESKMAPDSVSAQIIKNSAVVESKLAENAVTTEKVAPSAITVQEIADNAVTHEKIVSRTILAGDIAAGAITSYEIKANTITANQIAGNSITAAEIAANQITTKHIDSAVISAITASFQANIVVGDEGFVGANYDLADDIYVYTGTERRAYIDSDELTFQKNTIEGAVPSWIDTMTIGGEKKAIVFKEAGQRIGYNLDGSSEYSIAFAKARSSFSSYPAGMPDYPILSLESDGLIAFIETDSDHITGYMDMNAGLFTWNGKIKTGGLLCSSTLNTDPGAGYAVIQNRIEIGSGDGYIGQLTAGEPNYFAVGHGSKPVYIKSNGIGFFYSGAENGIVHIGNGNECVYLSGANRPELFVLTNTYRIGFGGHVHCNYYSLDYSSRFHCKDQGLGDLRITTTPGELPGYPGSSYPVIKSDKTIYFSAEGEYVGAWNKSILYVRTGGLSVNTTDRQGYAARIAGSMKVDSGIDTYSITAGIIGGDCVGLSKPIPTYPDNIVALNLWYAGGFYWLRFKKPAVGGSSVVYAERRS